MKIWRNQKGEKIGREAGKDKEINFITRRRQIEEKHRVRREEI